MFLGAALAKPMLMLAPLLWSICNTDPKATASDLVLVGTVTRIAPSGAPSTFFEYTWVVTVRVENIVSGTFSGSTLTFFIHSPAMAGLEVGGSYTIKANWVDSVYLVHEWEVKRASMH